MPMHYHRRMPTNTRGGQTMDLTDKQRRPFEAAFEEYCYEQDSDSEYAAARYPQLSLEDLVAYVQANN